jgi:hypothetical protein
MSGKKPGRKKRGYSDVYVPPNAPTIYVGKPGRPPGKNTGPTRSTQQQGTAAAAAARLAAAISASEVGAGGGGDDQDNMDDQQPSEHAIRASRVQEAWKDQMPKLRSIFFDELPRSCARAAEQAEGRRQALQAELDGSWKGHVCQASTGAMHDTCSFSKQMVGEVAYFGTECVFKLSLPKWTCSRCCESFSPDALELGCFASTPTTPHVWYDLRVLKLYKRLGLGEGLSATGGRDVEGEE